MSRWTIIAMGAGRPKGCATLAQFLTDYEAGRIPKSAATDAVARAFREALESSKDEAACIAKALKLVGRRGEKKPVSAGTLLARSSPVWRFIEARISTPPKRGEVTRAIEAAAAKFNRSDERIRQIWADRKKFPRLDTTEIERQIGIMKRNLSASEWDKWQHRSARALYRLAQFRERGKKDR